MPFLRQTLTIVPTWEPDPVTVEVIALKLTSRGEFHGATAREGPAEWARTAGTASWPGP